MSSRIGIKAVFLCAHPRCGAEAIQHGIVANLAPAVCRVEIDMPSGWRAIDFETFCPQHQAEHRTERSDLRARLHRALGEMA